MVGCLAGLCLHYLTRLFVVILGLDRTDESPPGRTAASYRAERARKQARKAKEHLMLEGLQTRFDQSPTAEYSDGTRNGMRTPLSPAPKKGLLSTTIFEEEDSSEADFD